MEKELFEIDCHGGKKVFCLQEIEDFYLSGGEDGNIVKHTFN